MRYSSLSEKGRRPNNEDVVFTRFDPRYPLIAAVSDGMGGHAAGEVASRISIEALDMWTRELVDAPQNVLVDAFFNAHAHGIIHRDVKPQNVITRCIGSEASFEPDVFYTRWNPKDLVILCSDGLCDALREEDILALVQQKTDLDTLCHALAKAAYDKGSADNISLVLVRNEGGVEL